MTLSNRLAFLLVLATGLLGPVLVGCAAAPNDDTATESGAENEVNSAEGDFAAAKVTFRTAAYPCNWNDALARKDMSFNVEAWDGTAIPEGGLAPALLVMDASSKLVAMGLGWMTIGADGGVYFESRGLKRKDAELGFFVQTSERVAIKVGTLRNDVRTLAPGDVLDIALTSAYAFKRTRRAVGDIANPNAVVLVATGEPERVTSFAPLKVPASAERPQVPWSGKCSTGEGE